MLPLEGERGGLPAVAVATALAAAVVAPPPPPPPPLPTGDIGRVGEGVRTPPLVGDSASRLLRDAAEVRGTGQAREHDRVEAGAAAPVAAVTATPEEEEEEEEEAEGGGGVSGSGTGEEEAEGAPNGDGGEPIRVRGGEAGQCLADTPPTTVSALPTPRTPAAAAAATGESGSGIEGDVGRGGVDTPPPLLPLPPG